MVRKTTHPSALEDHTTPRKRMRDLGARTMRQTARAAKGEYKTALTAVRESESIRR